MPKARRLGTVLAVSALAFAGSAPPVSSAGVRRHAVGRVAAALRADGLEIVRPGRLYRAVCPQILPRRRTDGYIILVSPSRACDAVVRRTKTGLHARGSRWLFATRFDNIALLYDFPRNQITDASQALVGFLEVFVVLD
jgi:hypothetical protein